MILGRMPLNATAGLTTATKQDADECSRDERTSVKDLADRLMHGITSTRCVVAVLVVEGIDGGQMYEAGEFDKNMYMPCDKRCCFVWTYEGFTCDPPALSSSSGN